MAIPTIVGRYTFRKRYATRFAGRSGPMRAAPPHAMTVVTHQEGYDPALGSMKSDLLTEYNLRGGGGESFSHQPPHYGSAVDVHFLGDSLTAEKFTASAFVASATFEEEPNGS